MTTKTKYLLLFIAAFAAIMLCSLVTAAQRLSITAGPMLTTYNHTANMVTTGIAAGITHTRNRVTITGMYAQKGGRYGRIDTTRNYKLRIDYITVSATYRVLPVLSVGAYGGYLLDRVHGQYMYDHPVKWLATHWDIIHRFDAGLVADVCVPLPPVLSVGCRYDYGVLPVGAKSWAPLYRMHNTTGFVYLKFYIVN